MWNNALISFALIGVVTWVTAAEETLITTSFEFLDKYTHKQYRNVVSLTISNSSINKIDPKLKYLKNLNYLDLSHNNVQISSIPTLNKLKTLKLNANSLKSMNMSLLPHNIQELDLSNNLLQHIPKDWRVLHSLKVLHLQKNPIDCECNNVLNYERLVKSEVLIPEAVICHSPQKYLGKDIASVNCSLDDIMLYDEPDSGSGSVDIFDEISSEARNIPLIEEGEPESNITIVDDLIEVHTTTTEASAKDILEEGSGDEGSGYIISLPESGILGCIENCSTPGPIGTHDEEYASPLPSPWDQFKILADDLNPFKQFDEQPSTKAPTTSTTTTSTTTEQPNKEDSLAKEPRLLKTNDRIQVESEKPTEKPNTFGEIERASSAPQNSNAVYAIAGILCFAAVLFFICFIKKRRAASRNKKNRREDANVPNGEEMKPLSKPTIQTMNEKPTKNAQNIPEHIPLINGQNGAASKRDSPVLKSYTPLPHPEAAEPEETPEAPTQNGQIVSDSDDVELRRHQPELLTPQRERVTIRESEIPESIPKTPLLVHRQKNSDGDIITVIP